MIIKDTNIISRNVTWVRKSLRHYIFQVSCNFSIFFSPLNYKKKQSQKRETVLSSRLRTILYKMMRGTAVEIYTRSSQIQGSGKSAMGV